MYCWCSQQILTCQFCQGQISPFPWNHNGFFAVLYLLESFREDYINYTLSMSTLWIMKLFSFHVATNYHVFIVRVVSQLKVVLTLEWTWYAYGTKSIWYMTLEYLHDGAFFGDLSFAFYWLVWSLILHYREYILCWWHQTINRLGVRPFPYINLVMLLRQVLLELVVKQWIILGWA